MNRASRWLAAVALGVPGDGCFLQYVQQGEHTVGGPRTRDGSGAPSTILGFVP